MNKTLTVNIGGIVFHIEEQAYEKLRKYLDAIKAYFTSSDGRDEIIQDIEARIAEMFQERIKNNLQPLIESDVEEVIQIMGKPEQFAGDSREESSSGGTTNDSGYTNTYRGYRRIFRDPDDKVVGGVCSGISYRLGIDPIWLRLTFALVFFAAGSGFFLYIILMIILPKARTAAEKLEMRGEPVNIENIKKSVAEEMDSIKASVNDYAKGNRPLNFTRKTGSFMENFFETLLDIIRIIFKVAVKVIAVFMLIIGLIVFGSLLLALVAVMGVDGIHVPVFLTNFFLTPSQQFWTFTALFFLLGVPFLMLVYAGIKMLFGVKYDSSLIRYAAGSLFLVGIVIAIFMGFDISRNYRVRDSSRISVPIIQPMSDTLYISSTMSENYEHHWGIQIDDEDDFSVLSGALDSIMRIRHVKLDIQKATGESFELLKVQTGRGRNRSEAEINSRKMNYKFQQQDSLIILDPSFTISKDVKFRNQQLSLILKVPVGKTIFLDDNTDNIIYDIDNVTNTYDKKMLNHYWIMTPKGLKCTDFDFSDGSEVVNDSDDKTHHITINGKEVNISSGAEVHIDKNGIDIQDDKKNVHVKIDENGIKVEDKENKNE